MSTRSQQTDTLYRVQVRIPEGATTTSMRQRLQAGAGLSARQIDALLAGLSTHPGGVTIKKPLPLQRAHHLVQKMRSLGFQARIASVSMPDGVVDSAPVESPGARARSDPAPPLLSSGADQPRGQWLAFIKRLKTNLADGRKNVRERLSAMRPKPRRSQDSAATPPNPLASAPAILPEAAPEPDGKLATEAAAAPATQGTVPQAVWVSGSNALPLIIAGLVVALIAALLIALGWGMAKSRPPSIAPSARVTPELTAANEMEGPAVQKSSTADLQAQAEIPPQSQPSDSRVKVSAAGLAYYDITDLDAEDGGAALLTPMAILDQAQGEQKTFPKLHTVLEQLATGTKAATDVVQATLGDHDLQAGWRAQLLLTACQMGQGHFLETWKLRADGSIQGQVCALLDSQPEPSTPELRAQLQSLWQATRSMADAGVAMDTALQSTEILLATGTSFGDKAALLWLDQWQQHLSPEGEHAAYWRDAWLTGHSMRLARHAETLLRQGYLPEAHQALQDILSSFGHATDSVTAQALIAAYAAQTAAALQQAPLARQYLQQSMATLEGMSSAEQQVQTLASIIRTSDLARTPEVKALSQHLAERFPQSSLQGAQLPEITWILTRLDMDEELAELLGRLGELQNPKLAQEITAMGISRQLAQAWRASSQAQPMAALAILKDLAASLNLQH